MIPNDIRVHAFMTLTYRSLHLDRSLQNPGWSPKGWSNPVGSPISRKPSSPIKNNNSNPKNP